jgi:hypothetical protein
MFKVWNDAQKGRHVTERDFRIERRDEKEKHKRGCRSMQVRHLDFRRARWVFIVYRLFLMPPSAKISWSVRETYYTDCGIVYDKQDVRVPRHSVKHRRKFTQLHLERVKLPHARVQLQRLDQLTRVLVPR